MLVYVYCTCKFDFVSMLASCLHCCMVRHLFLHMQCGLRTCWCQAAEAMVHGKR